MEFQVKALNKKVDHMVEMKKIGKAEVWWIGVMVVLLVALILVL